MKMRMIAGIAVAGVLVVWRLKGWLQKPLPVFADEDPD